MGNLDVDLVTGDLPGSTGVWTVSLTSGFGVPKGVILCLADVDADDTARDDAALSYGCGKWAQNVSTSQWCEACFDDHGVVTPAVFSEMQGGSSDRIGLLLDNTGATDVEVRLLNFEPDQVVFQVTKSDHARGRYWLWAIGGTQVEVDVGTVALDPKAGNQKVDLFTAKVPTGVLVGYQAARGAHINQGASSNHARMGLGFASIVSGSITQRGLAASWKADPGAGYSEVSMGWFSRLGSEFNEGNFRLVSVAQKEMTFVQEEVNSSQMDFGYMVFYGANCLVGTQGMASTGSTAVTRFGFEPYGMLFVNSLLNTGDVEDDSVSNARAGGWGAGAVSRSLSESSAAGNHKNNSSPEDTQSNHDASTAGNMPAHGGGGGVQWNVTTLDSDGYTYEVTNALSGTRVSLFMALGLAPPVTSPPPRSSPSVWATISGPVASHAEQSGPVAAQASVCGPRASQASQSGAVAAQASQSGPVAARAKQSN